jgi:hypothetical protein
MNESVRLLELLIGLSDATDFGIGLKAGESVRSAALAVERISRRIEARLIAGAAPVWRAAGLGDGSRRPASRLS